MLAMFHNRPTACNASCASIFNGYVLNALDFQCGYRSQQIDFADYVYHRHGDDITMVVGICATEYQSVGDSLREMVVKYPTS